MNLLKKLRFLRMESLEDNIKMDFSEVDRGNGNFLTVRIRAKEISTSQPASQPASLPANQPTKQPKKY
jgi:hypothetical protein